MVGSCVLEFSANDPLARPVIDALYHAADDTTATPTHHYRIERAGDEWRGLAPQRAPYGPTTLEDVFAFLEWRATEDILASQDAIFLHAAGVKLGSANVLVIGSSGAGKSTLAAHLFAQGHQLWGDDLVRFATVERAFSAAPRSLKLDAKALKSLDLMSNLCSEAVRGTLLAPQVAYLSPAAFRRGWRAPEGRADIIVLLDGATHGEPLRLEQTSAASAALTAGRMLIGGGAMGTQQEQAGLMAEVVEAMRDVRAYRAAGSPASALAAALERELAA